MMRYMRHNAVFVLVIIILIIGVFIGTIFLVWGRGSMTSSSGERSVVAWVGEAEIPYADYLRAHDTRLEFYRRFYPNVTPEEIEKRFKVKKGALDSVVGRRLLVDEAGRMGLVATPEEILAKVQGNSAFQDNGQFSPDRYRQVLATSNVSTAAYESELRNEILAEKVRAIVQEAVQVSEAEAFEEFREEKEKVRLRLLTVPADAAAVAVSADEARRAFDADPAKYTLPERAQFAWIAILASGFRSAEVPAEAELQRYYDEHPEEFRTGRAVRARHILFRLAEDAPADEEKKIRDRAGFVLEKAKKGADFAALAQEFSQDASGPQGGDLGWFEAGRMVPAFEQAAFALAKGGVSDLVRTQFGIHVIKVDDTREAGVTPFEESRAAIAGKMAAGAARDKAAARSEELNNELYDRDFAEVAGKFGLPVRTTELVSREQPLPGPATRPEIAQSLFSLAEGEVSEIIRQGDDYYAYRLVTKRPAAVPSFEEARPAVERDLARERARERALGAARLLLAELRGGAAPAAVAARVKGELRESAFFGRRDFVAEAGVKGDVFREAFALAAGAWGGPVAGEDGRAVLFSLIGTTPATREAFAAEKDATVAKLRTARRDLVFEAWVEDLRRARQVRVNESLVGAL